MSGRALPVSHQWLGAVNSGLKKSESGDRSWVLEKPKTYDVSGGCMCTKGGKQGSEKLGGQCCKG